jgi:hypothetical protein
VDCFVEVESTDSREKTTDLSYLNFELELSLECSSAGIL